MLSAKPKSQLLSHPFFYGLSILPLYSSYHSANYYYHDLLQPDGTLNVRLPQPQDKVGILDGLKAGALKQIKHQNYPQTDAERDSAITKAFRSEGDKSYSARDRNCQHYVNDMLMGERISMDIERSERVRLIACIVDSLSQFAGRPLSSLWKHIERISMWSLKQLYACCQSGGFLRKVFGSTADDVGEYINNICNILAKPELTPLQRVLKDGSFAILIEFIVFTLQTCTEVWRLYKGKKSAQDIAPVLLKRFLAIYGGAGGTMAGSALATFILGLAPFSCTFLLCQVIGAIFSHAFAYYFGSWFCGGWLENAIKYCLNFLKDRVLPFFINLLMHLWNFVSQVHLLVSRGLFGDNSY